VLASLPIPLPPLAEQQRIAAILDKAEEIKRKREQAIVKLDELAKSTFVETLNDKTNKKIKIQDLIIKKEFYLMKAKPCGAYRWSKYNLTLAKS